MKTLIVSLAALAAVSTAALAERNYDISSPPYGEVIFGVKKKTDYSNVQPLAVPVYGKVGRFPSDDAKNDSSSHNGRYDSPSYKAR